MKGRASDASLYEGTHPWLDRTETQVQIHLWVCYEVCGLCLPEEISEAIKEEEPESVFEGLSPCCWHSDFSSD